MKKILCLLLFGFELMAQNQMEDFTKTAIQSSKYWLDIDYVGDKLIGHKLDIHLPPKGTGPFPVVVSIYGSAWLSNSWKANTFKDGIGQPLLENGFAVVSINYRSSGDAVFPAQIQDVKAAIRFIRAHVNDFKLDTSFVGITGWSSGGHLAALAGVSNGKNAAIVQGLAVDLIGTNPSNANFSSEVDAVVDWFGPTDFLQMDKCGSSFSHDAPESPESKLVGGAIQSNLEKVALANPMNYVDKDCPPFLIFHGDKDPLVPHCQSELLHDQLQSTQVKSELNIITNGGHGPGVIIPENLEKMVNFFVEIRASKRK